MYLNKKNSKQINKQVNSNAITAEDELLMASVVSVAFLEFSTLVAFLA